MGTEELTFGIVSLTVLIFLYLYAFGGSFFEAKHFHLIHETGLGILLGMLGGLVIYYCFPSHLQQLTAFNKNVFFYLLLPIIIFAGGYNLNKKRFVQNFFYVFLYGVAGTVIAFFLITIFTYWVNSWGWVRLAGSFDEIVYLNIYEIMIFAATMCASDAVAALTMIKADQYPKLFSVVFGEGMINDAVSIIIFITVKSLTDESGDNITFYWYTPIKLIGQFFYEFSCSILFGAAVGMFTTWMFKTFRFLTQNCVIETIMILYMGYVSFSLCQIVDLSGVISALVCGVFLAHYNFYNMSSIGKISSQVTISSISMVCESFIYVYLGVSIWELQTTSTGTGNAFSWTFVIAEMIIAFLARAIMISFMSFATIGIRGRKKWRLTFWEISIIWFAGLIRGSVAFALIQSLEPANKKQNTAVQIVQTTVLFMVIITTIVLGGMMPFYINVNLSQQERNQVNVVPRESVKSTKSLKKSLITGIQEYDGEGETEESKKYRSKFQNLVKRFDEKFLKPFLIYKYNERKDEIERAKKFMKMNAAEFDPQKFGTHSILKQAKQNNSVFSQLQDRESQMYYTKIQVKSGYNSKFGGHQDLTIDFDVPIEQPEKVKQLGQSVNVPLEPCQEDDLDQVNDEVNENEKEDEKEDA